MKTTPARVRFKEHFGQANHFLVTSIVALHALEKSGMSAAPPELSTTWNPQSKQASIERTRIFILHAALNSAVDAIDMYISLLYRKPNYLSDAVICSALDGAGRSVGAKIAVMKKHYSPPAAETALVEILVTWRNNTIHELADNKVELATRNALAKNEAYIAQNFCGLTVGNLAGKAEAGDSLSFKETTSLINAAHKFVQHIDQEVIARLDLQKICRDLVAEVVLSDDPECRTFSQKYFALPETGRARCVANWLATNYGIANVPADQLEDSLHIARPAATMI